MGPGLGKLILRASVARTGSRAGAEPSTKAATKAEAGSLLDHARGDADLLHLALVEDGDAVGQLEGLILVMGDEQSGMAGLVVELAQPAAQFLAHLGVERAERLVQQQDARPMASARASATRWRWPPDSCAG